MSKQHIGSIILYFGVFGLLPFLISKDKYGVFGLLPFLISKDKYLTYKRGDTAGEKPIRCGWLDDS
jgi:uncharacterized membrane protein